MITIRVNWRHLLAVILLSNLAVVGLVGAISRARTAADFSACVVVLEGCLERAAGYAREAALEADAEARRELVGRMLGATQAGSYLVCVLNSYDPADPRLAAVCSRLRSLLGELWTPEALEQHAARLEAVLAAVRSAKDGDRVVAHRLMDALRRLELD